MNKTINRSIYLMSKSLVLPNVTLEDKGVYHCRAEIEPTKYEDVSAKVTVFGVYAFKESWRSLQVIEIQLDDFTKSILSSEL